MYGNKICHNIFKIIKECKSSAHNQVVNISLIWYLCLNKKNPKKLESDGF